MDNKIFDVAKPQHSKPDATSKPIIVGHRPQTADPMVREHALPDQPLVHHTGVESSGFGAGARAESSIAPDQQPENLGGNITASDRSTEDLAPNIKEPNSQHQYSQDPSLLVDLAKTAPKVHNQDWQPEKKLPISGLGNRRGAGRKQRKLPAILLLCLITVLALYALIDSKTIDIGIELPVHIFNQDQVAQKNSAPAAGQVSVSVAPSNTAFYIIKGTDISFVYPVAWGTPNTLSESGYSQRGGTNKPSGTYAYLVTFSKNKNIQVAVTASQYLPVARTALYHDFLKWCTGTADGKIYKSALGFTTTEGIDTPTTAVCNQGPLADAEKIDENTIVQTKTKNPDGSQLGDLYTVNLSDSDLPVFRIKDASSTSSESIKKLLISLKG